MASRDIIGPQDRFERMGAQRLRDIRPFSTRLWDVLMSEASALFLSGAAIAMFVEPALVDVFVPGSILYAALVLTQRVTLPLRLPQSARMKDWNYPDPADRRPRMAAGSLYIGTNLSRQQLWLSSDDARQHATVPGTTGAGKTTAILSFLTNALCQGSGFVLVDGKADNKLYGEALALARRFGREDDVLCLNFMRAIKALRDMNRMATPSLPKSAPTSFVRQRWARHVLLPGGVIDRRYYELCVLSELRDRLRAGDVWVMGSRRFRAFEERLISRETLQELQQNGDLPIAVETDFESFIAGRRAFLDERLALIDAKAKDGLLPDVTIDKGALKITPIAKSTPPEAEALAARLYAMLPRVRITDLLSEAARWTLFPDCFTHLRTGETAGNPQILMASLLADGLNLGLTRMAEACSIASLGQLAWTSEWHIRDETYALALQRLVNQQQRKPLAAMFGDAGASSSDGQFFRAGGRGRAAANLNAHYGDDPGAKFYTHISSRYAPFYIKAIPATASEALHVLDALLYHQTDVMTNRHHTDGGGVSDHVFALCSLFGLRFAPRIPDLKDRRLYSFNKPSAYPAIEPMIAGRINVALIRAHWQEILRILVALWRMVKTGEIPEGVILRPAA